MVFVPRINPVFLRQAQIGDEMVRGETRRGIVDGLKREGISMSFFDGLMGEGNRSWIWSGHPVELPGCAENPLRAESRQCPDFQ
jgi:hypothetical protein